jgi:hypothetical protein
LILKKRKILGIMEGIKDMSATTVIEDILKDKGKLKADLADELNITRQNLSNKINRDNFSSLELVEVADALNMELILKDKTDGKEYIIDYPSELKGKAKRNMTEKAKKEAQEKSMKTKQKNLKQHEQEQ